MRQAPDRSVCLQSNTAPDGSADRDQADRVWPPLGYESRTCRNVVAGIPKARRVCELLPARPRASNTPRPSRKPARTARSEMRPARVERRTRSLRDVTARMSEPALRPLSDRLAAATTGSEPFWQVCVFRPARPPDVKPSWSRLDRRAAYWFAHSRAVAKQRRYG